MSTCYEVPNQVGRLWNVGTDSMDPGVPVSTSRGVEIVERPPQFRIEGPSIRKPLDGMRVET